MHLKAISTKIGSGATPTGGQAAYQELRTNFALIRSQNVLDRAFSESGLAFISDDQASGLKGVHLERDDLLLNITGDGVTFGRACLVPSSVLPACVNQHVSIIRLDRDKAEPGYVLSYLTHPTVKEYVEAFNAGGSRRAITKAHIESFVVPLPPLSTQKAIAQILAELDDRITLLRETNATLEAIAQALFKSWFVDFDPVRAKMEGRVPEGMDEATAALFPNALVESGLGLVPEGWSHRSLKEVCSIFDSKRVPLSGAERNRRRGPYPYYGAAALMDYVDEYLFDGIYLLTGEDGSVADEQGFPITQYVWGKFWVNNHAHILQGKAGFSTEHLALALRRVNIQPYITGAVQAKLSQSNMWRINVLNPGQNIAEVFGKLIAPLYESVRANVEQAQTLATLRDTLLPRLISGQLRLPEVEHED